jgi:hypothetical protein
MIIDNNINSLVSIEVLQSSFTFIADGMNGAVMYELVRVFRDNLIGEIICLKGDLATIRRFCVPSTHYDCIVLVLC